MSETTPKETSAAPTETQRYYITESTKEVDILGGTWDSENGIYKLEPNTDGISTEFKLKKYPTTPGFSVVTEYKYKNIEDPKTGELVKTEVKWNKQTKQWEPHGTSTGTLDVFKQYKKLPFKGSVKTGVVNSVPKTTLHIEKTTWIER